jgi:hypothetical protein
MHMLQVAEAAMGSRALVHTLCSVVLAGIGRDRESSPGILLFHQHGDCDLADHGNG